MIEKNSSKVMNDSDRWQHRLPVFYGWVMIGVAGLIIFCTGPGQTFSFSLFIDSFIDDFGWSRTLVSSLYSCATLISGCLMFLVGRLVDRFGARWICLVSASLLALGCFLGAVIAAPLSLFLVFFIGRFSGQGSLGLSASTLPPRWFTRRRAFAIMLAGLGGTAAAVVYPLLNGFLIERYGWRSAFRILGAGVVFIAIPLTFLIVSKPEDIAMSPDGRTDEDGGYGNRQGEAEVSFSQKQMLRTPAFWLLAFCFLQQSLVGTGIAFHYLSIFNQHGYTNLFAARIMSISPLAGILATVAAGLFLDRFQHPQRFLAAVFLVQGAAWLMLLSLSGIAAAVVFSVLSGMSAALIMLIQKVLRPYLYGRMYLGGISGVFVVVGVIGSALGPLPFGAAYDRFGGYREILVASCVLPIVSAILSLFIKKPEMNP